MHWSKVDATWDKIKATPEGGQLESGITYQTELWPVPGDQPLPVRVCTNKHAPLSKYASVRSSEKTSIVLHLTAGYPGFNPLMGGAEHSSAHFMLGRDGFAYQLVPTESIAWHASWWDDNSIGIEIDNIAGLTEKSGNLLSTRGANDVYCAKGDTGVFVEKDYNGIKFWAALTEVQYQSLGRLIKALCHKHKIPRYLLPEEKRYKPFSKEGDDRRKFRGVCTHINIDPANRADIGPFIDWSKVIQLGGLTEGDCFNAPPYQADAPAKAGTAAPKSTPAAAPPPEAPKAEAAPPPAPKAEAPKEKSKLTWEQIEQKVLGDEYKLVGDWGGDGFVDADLNLLLRHYCEEEKMNAVTAGSDGLPAWLGKWRERFGGGSTWDRPAQGRAGLAEAFCRAWFRDVCKQNGIPYSPAADEFFAEMYKSEKNGQHGDMIGLSPRKPAAPKPKERPEDPKPADEPAATPIDSTVASSGEKAAEKLGPQNEPGLKPFLDQYRAAMGRAARDLSKAEACIILSFLHHAGFLSLLNGWTSKTRKKPSISGSTLNWPSQDDRVGYGPWIKFKDGGEPLPEPGQSKVGPIPGHFGFVYNGVNSKWAGNRATLKDKSMPLIQVDPRNAVALYRAANWMQEQYSVTEMYHAGINGSDPKQRNDCHGQGRALDFSGVVGAKDGIPFEWFVINDWGNQPVPADRKGDSPSNWAYKDGGTTYRLAHRLDEAQPSPARFFWDAFKFFAAQYRSGDMKEFPRSLDTPITTGGFIMHPDHKTSAKGTANGREAHKNHFHCQIGDTGTAKADDGMTSGAPAPSGGAPSPKPKPAAGGDTPASDTPPPAPKPKPAGEPGKTIKSSNLTVGGAPFPDWYNANVATIREGKNFFPKIYDKKRWADMFDHCDQILKPELTLKEYVFIFMIMCNETGGGFKPVGEVGRPKELPMKYFFEAGSKATYNNNGGNRGAGDQLAAKHIISDAEEIKRWNGKVWPADVGPDSPLIPHLKECDFNKYRGHGLIQTTFRPADHGTVDPILKKLGKPQSDDLSADELEKIILTTPAVYFGMVKNFFNSGYWKTWVANLEASEPTDVCTKASKGKWPCIGQSVYFNIGFHVSGGKAYAQLYEWRTSKLLEAMQRDNYECR